METLETRTIEFDNETRKYRVMNNGTVPGAPRWFIAYNKGSPFISDEVPRDYMEYMVLHELTEFEKLAGQENRCVNALRAELNAVPEDMKKEYIQFREEVFTELMGYLKSHNQDLNFISEVGKSLAYLRELTGGNK